jgi:hypothetical protein
MGNEEAEEVRHFRRFLHRSEIAYAYYNNHYSGFGLGFIALFRKLRKSS